MPASRSALSAALLCALLATACVKRPQGASEDAAAGVALPANFLEGERQSFEVASGIKALFRSGSLSADIDRALIANPDLKGAAYRLQEAGFNTRSARSGLYPAISANGGASRGQSNSAGAGFNAGTFAFERYTASLDVSWEPDVWGRIRAGVAAADLEFSGAAADYEAARQSLAAQTAQSHFSLIGATLLESLAKRRLESFESTFRLVDRRFESGLSNFGDVQLARTDVENARSTVAERSNSREQVARELSVLLGRYPSAARKGGGFPGLRRQVAAGVPSSLLRERPDVFAAYQRLRASNQRITIAHAQLFPSFPLTASGGRQSSTLRDLASAQFNVWSLAGNVTAPIFAAGALRAELDAADARAKQAFTNYQSLVLNALREVEDALAAEGYLRQQESATRAALDAAQSAEKRVRTSYDRGLVEILTLLDAQRRSFAAEEALISIQTLRYQNRVSLALAVGKAL